jgi:hypothetical protein
MRYKGWWAAWPVSRKYAPNMQLAGMLQHSLSHVLSHADTWRGWMV